MKKILIIDFGCTSARGIKVSIENRKITTEELLRVPYTTISYKERICCD